MSETDVPAEVGDLVVIRIDQKRNFWTMAPVAAVSWRGLVTDILDPNGNRIDWDDGIFWVVRRGLFRPTAPLGEHLWKIFVDYQAIAETLRPHLAKRVDA